MAKRFVKRAERAYRLPLDDEAKPCTMRNNHRRALVVRMSRILWRRPARPGWSCKPTILALLQLVPQCSEPPYPNIAVVIQDAHVIQLTRRRVLRQARRLVRRQVAVHVPRPSVPVLVHGHHSTDVF